MIVSKVDGALQDNSRMSLKPLINSLKVYLAYMYFSLAAKKLNNTCHSTDTNLLKVAVFFSNIVSSSVFCNYFAPLQRLVCFLLLRGLKHESILCGDFKNDKTVDSNFRKDYKKLLSAYDFKHQHFKPTIVTATSSTFLDHLITSFQVQTETITKTISDHFTVLAETLLLTNEPKHQPSFRKTRDLRGIEGDRALKFLFLLN